MEKSQNGLPGAIFSWVNMFPQVWDRYKCEGHKYFGLTGELCLCQILEQHLSMPNASPSSEQGGKSSLLELLLGSVPL